MKKALVVAVLIVALILGIVAYAFAATDHVDVTARVNAKLVMQLSDTAYTFTGPLTGGNFDPDSSAATWSGMSVNVKSNAPYSFGHSWSGDTAAAFSDTFADVAVNAKTPSRNHTGDIVFTPNYDIDPGAYTAALQFTAAQ
jgi:predicted lipoprotein with Yx(FWY)xxD motif